MEHLIRLVLLIDVSNFSETRKYCIQQKLENTVFNVTFLLTGTSYEISVFGTS